MLTVPTPLKPVSTMSPAAMAIGRVNESVMILPRPQATIESMQRIYQAGDRLLLVIHRAGATQGLAHLTIDAYRRRLFR